MQKSTALAGLLLLASSTAAELPVQSLPLGMGSLNETRQVAELLPGVQLTTIMRGHYSNEGQWVVTLDTLADKNAAQQKVAALAAAGYQAYLTPVETQGAGRADYGQMVRVGGFTSKAQADALQAQLKADGFSGGVQFTAEDGRRAVTGPWFIQVLTVAPDAQAEVRAVIAKDTIPGRETVSSMAKRTGAVAGVNGGFFVVADNWGTVGDLAGISVNNGELLSEAVAGRPALWLDRKAASGQIVPGLASKITIMVGGASREATGLNRQPGLVTNCGNAVATPTTQAAHDIICKSSNELIVFRAAYGEWSHEGEGVEVSVGPDGRVQAVQMKRGMAIPAGGFTVQATDAAAEWLKTHAVKGEKLTVNTRLTDATGRRIPLNEGTDIVNGGPTLVQSGKVVYDYAAEGWSPQGFTPEGPASEASRVNFYNGWVLRRNPRTAAGVMGDGTLMLVTVDGRNPTHSIGASIPEMGTLMQALGAEQAINLDGGGSTVMYANGLLQSIPSDAAGEREDADAVLIFPAAQR